MATTQQQQREAAEKISDAFVKAYNTGDTSLIEPVVSDDFVCHHLPAGVDLKGATEYAGRIKEIRGAFEGFEMKEEFLVVEDDMCVGRYRWSGKHTDTFQGIPPTKKSVDTTSISISRMEDGKMAEMWVYSDSSGMMKQLGIDLRPGK